MPELRHLRAFMILAEELNFTRAAARVFVTQPALSHQIQRLEEELGLTLLRRTSRQVTLTEDGERFLKLSRQVITTLDDGLRDLRKRSTPHVLKVGYADYVGHTGLPQRLQRLRDCLPGTEVRQIEGSTLEQLQGLQDGHLDLGFFVATRVRSPGVKSRKLWQEELVLALPENHSLAGLDTVPLGALDGQKLLLNSAESNPDMWKFMHGLFEQAGIQPVTVVNPGARMYSFAGIMRLIAEHEGLFLIVKSLQGVGYPGVTFRPVCDPAPGIPMRIAWRDTLPSRVQDLLMSEIVGQWN